MDFMMQILSIFEWLDRIEAWVTKCAVLELQYFQE